MQLHPLTVYLVLQADQVLNICSSIVIIALILAGISTIVLMIAGPILFFEEVPVLDHINKFPYKKHLAIILLIPVLILAFMPSTKTLAAMLIAPAIVNSSVVQKDLPELYTLGVEKLKEAMGVTPQPENK